MVLATLDLSQLTVHGQTLTFEYTGPFGQPTLGFVVCWHGRWLAYRNLCPHWSSRLDVRGSFFPSDGAQIVCQVHGARFDPETGECILGPALGSRLESLSDHPGRGGSCQGEDFTWIAVVALSSLWL